MYFYIICHEREVKLKTKKKQNKKTKKKNKKKKKTKEKQQKTVYTVKIKTITLNRTLTIICCNCPENKTIWFYKAVMRPIDVDEIENNVSPDQTATMAGSALFVQGYLSSC